MSLAEIVDAVSYLSQDERAELKKHLLKIDIENDTQLWAEIRERTDSYSPAKNNYLPISEL